MLKTIANWREKRRLIKLNKNQTWPTRKEILERMESIGIHRYESRIRLFRDPLTGEFWALEYHEHGMGNWEEIKKFDQQIGEAVVKYP